MSNPKGAKAEKIYKAIMLLHSNIGTKGTPRKFYLQAMVGFGPEHFEKIVDLSIFEDFKKVPRGHERTARYEAGANNPGQARGHEGVTEWLIKGYGAR